MLSVRVTLQSGHASQFLLPGQMFLMDRFFDGTFLTFGIEVISFAERDQEDRIDPMVSREKNEFNRISFTFTSDIRKTWSVETLTPWIPYFIGYPWRGKWGELNWERYHLKLAFSFLLPNFNIFLLYVFTYFLPQPIISH